VKRRDPEGPETRADAPIAPGAAKRGKLLAFLASPAGILIVLADLYVMGVVFHVIPATRPIVLAITPAFLALTGFAALLAARPRIDRRAALWLAGTFAATFALEALGVATGLVFGAYGYGDVLGLKLLGVPLVIGFNWAVIVFGLASGIERLLPRATYLQPLLTGLGALAFDALMEPVAIRLGYWAWADAAVPLRNYVAWFLIAAACGGAYRLARIGARNPAPIVYVGMQAAFLAALRIALA